MIAFLQVLPAGNAVRVIVTPPATATKWRILRRTADAFTGYNDAGAVLVSESADNAVLDTIGLTNGVAYFWKPYYFDGSSWSEAPAETATPAATYAGAGPDPLTMVRDRLQLGIDVEIARGTLTPKTGKIPVLNAAPQFEDTHWPVVTVHLEQDKPVDRAVGEMLVPDRPVTAGWEVSEGWISQVRLTVVSWSLNPDERIALRRALKRIIIANLPVFDDAGMVQVEFDQSDIEDFTSYPAPVYQTIGQFTCLAPSVVTDEETAISAVESVLIPYEEV